jgi:hypothetical protein
MDDILELTEEESLKYEKDNMYMYRYKIGNKEIMLNINGIKILRLTQQKSIKYYIDKEYREELKDKKIMLDLSSNIFINDVSTLRNVYILDLSYCYYIKDVSALGNVHELNLSFCEGIKDVSKLGNIHTLNLIECVGIKDVSELREVKVLKITKITEGIHLLKNLKKIILENYEIKGEINKLKKNNNEIKIEYSCVFI